MVISLPSSINLDVDVESNSSNSFPCIYLAKSKSFDSKFFLEIITLYGLVSLFLAV